jgi:hypothetical protein
MSDKKDDVLIVMLTTPTQTVYIADCVAWGTDVMPDLWTLNFQCAKRVNRPTAEQLVKELDGMRLDVIKMDTGGTMILSHAQHAQGQVIGHWDGV